VIWFARRNGIGAGEAFVLDGIGPHRAVSGRWVRLSSILGGIYGGVFAPTEAAAVACVYAGAGHPVRTRELAWRDVVEAAGTTAVPGQILIVVACANVFAWLLTVDRCPPPWWLRLQAAQIAYDAAALDRCRSADRRILLDPLSPSSS
jgi:C4-dicarboxylate transporter DctM subunit